MSFLRGVEQRIEGLIEGVFGRAFRTNVQPVELARKLAKEMDDHRTVSVSRIYVPNEYTVYLAPADREQFASYEGSLLEELQDHLADHARREKYAMLTQPRVLLETDDDLDLGEFGIATRMVQPERGRGETAPRIPATSGQTMVYKPAVNGRTHELDGRRVVIGRSKECDIQIADPNASRRHAELRREGDAYWLVDLGSTNGLDVNGKRTQRAKLANGDRVTIGTTELVFKTAP